MRGPALAGVLRVFGRQLGLRRALALRRSAWLPAPARAGPGLAAGAALCAAHRWARARALAAGPAATSSCARGIGLGIVLGRAAAQTRMPAATPGRSAMAWQEGA
ncbi:hypothetical protein CK625_00030 [Vandammella animalimorsus]|uniref:Uncharacterized protein n=1 Tax=Vandammella animalimorsus TaxID=2029117 RepID=A0A2A2AJS0_9BURK|nr:hypothetical protein CK625_00030 [Vandammella animalimorsus]